MGTSDRVAAFTIPMLLRILSSLRIFMSSKSIYPATALALPIFQMVVPFNPDWLDVNGLLTGISYPYLDAMGFGPTPVQQALICVVEDHVVISDGVSHIHQRVHEAIVTAQRIKQELPGNRRAVITPSQVEIFNSLTNEVVQTFRSYTDEKGQVVWHKTRQLTLVDYEPPVHHTPATVEGVYVGIESAIRRRWMGIARSISPDLWRRQHPWHRIKVYVDNHARTVREAMVIDDYSFANRTPVGSELDLYKRLVLDWREMHDSQAALAVLSEARAQMAEALSSRWTLERRRTEILERERREGLR